MRNTIFVNFIGIIFAVAGTVARAQTLPKSGMISLHTGFKAIGENIQVTDDRMQGNGSIYGVSFNDKGAGPLHNGPTICSYSYVGVSGAGTSSGVCYFSDPDGDKMFASFSATSSADGKTVGTNELTGGTGKYAGIHGGGPFACQWLSDKGHLVCTEEINYRLP